MASVQGALRNPYIDWLRGISILLVFATHGVLPAEFLTFLSPQFGAIAARNGYYGVTIFFVISGCLITSRSLARWPEPKAANPFQFYQMRAGRILPLLLLFLGVTMALYYLGTPNFTGGTAPVLFQAVGAALTLRFNGFLISANGWAFPNLAPLWSLSVEEAFYVAFPLALLLLRRRLFITALLVILVIQGPIGRQHFTDIYSYLGCADALALGCLTAMISPWVQSLRVPALAAFGLMVLGLLLSGYEVTRAFVGDGYGLPPTIVALGAAVFLTGAQVAPPLSWRAPVAMLLSPLALLGRLSYELYLFHITVAWLVADLCSWLDWKGAEWGIRFAALLGVAFLLNRLFTEPLNEWIRGLARPRAPTPTSDGPVASAS